MTPSSLEAPDPTVPDGGASERFGAPLTQRARRARATISTGLVVADVVLLAMIGTGVHGPSRFVVGLVVAVLVPGWAVVGLLRLGSAALEIGLTVALSLSVLMVAAQLLIMLDQWHLTALQVAVCVLALPSLGWQALDLRRPAPEGE
jgi:uncharacterized membrane protein